MSKKKNFQWDKKTFLIKNYYFGEKKTFSQTKISFLLKNLLDNIKIRIFFFNQESLYFLKTLF